MQSEKVAAVGYYQLTIGSRFSFFPPALSFSSSFFRICTLVLSPYECFCEFCLIVDNVAPGDRRALSRLTKNRLFAVMPVSSSFEDAEHPLITLIDQTTQDPTRRHQRVEAIRPILQYQHHLRIQNMAQFHQPCFPSFVNPARVEMQRSYQPHGSDQRRNSSAHSSRTHTGHRMDPGPTIFTNTGQANTGFASTSNAGQTGPPSYVSGANASQAVSPTFPFNSNFEHTMSSTRPELEHMIVSINRQKLVSDDMEWTTQFPLNDLRNSTTGDFLINQLSYSRLIGEISDKIRSNVGEEGLSVVWVMSAINQLGIVRDNGSLKAAVLDHQHAGKHIIQLYVVREKGKSAVSSNIPTTCRNLMRYSRGYRSSRSLHVKGLHSAQGSDCSRWPSQSRARPARRYA